MTFADFMASVRDALGLDNPGVVWGGIAGGLLRAFSRHRWKWREVFLSPMCGLLAAVNLTPIGMHVANQIARIMSWDMPADTVQTERAIAFLLGVSAMWLSDLLFAWVARRVKGRVPE